MEIAGCLLFIQTESIVLMSLDSLSDILSNTNEFMGLET